MQSATIAMEARASISQALKRSRRCLDSRYHYIRRISSTRNGLAEKQQTKEVPAYQVPDGPVPKASQLTNYLARQGAGSELLRGATEPYLAYGGTERLFKECLRQADYTIPNALKTPPEPAPKNAAEEDLGDGTGLWFAPKAQGGLELPTTFMMWAQIMFLHMYIITVRLRRFPADHVRIWEQHLLDHFCFAAEEKMAKYHGIATSSARNKNLKDIWLQWRGAVLSYDEGLIKGDAILAACVWRNLFKTSVDADVADVTRVTSYLKREVQKIDLINAQEVVSGSMHFGALTSKQDAKTAEGDETVDKSDVAVPVPGV